MSPKCDVATLSSLALYNVVTQVIHALSDDEGLYYNEVSEYHKYTPPEILEDMLTEILNNENLDAGIRFSCLQVFLKNKVKKLQTGIFPHSYYNQILEIILENGLSLNYLNLKGVWIKDNPILLNKVLKKLENLKVLHIPHMADDEALKTITTLKNLRVLDISGECNFTQDGLKQFSDNLKINQTQIKILDIGSFGEENISHEIIANLIETITNLESLCSYSFVGKSLQFIYNKNKNFKSKLKHIHDTRTSVEICKIISLTCPFLEYLYFDSPETDVISLIVDLPNLIKLKLTNFQCIELQNLLTVYGINLRILKLSLGRGIFDISVLSNCYSLKSLELYKMEFITHVTELPLINLENFEMTYSEMSSSCLKYVLKYAPQLKKITIGEPIKLTDGDLYRLCADLCLKSLEQLWCSNARYLTLNAIELLMRHCPNLRIIGQMTGWNIAPGDIDFMRAICQSTNTDLTILPLSAF